MNPGVADRGAPAARRRLPAVLGLLVACCLVGSLVLADPGTDGLAELQRLYDEGRFAEMETRARALLETVSAESGPDSLPAAEVMHKLVWALLRGGKFEAQETLDLARRALEIRRAQLAAGHPDVARSLNRLGSLHTLRSEYAIAKGYYEEAVAIIESASGVDRAEIEGFRTSLGNLYADLGDFPRARRVYEQAIAALEKLPDVKAEDLVRAYSNFGTILYEMKDFEPARQQFERALQVAEARLGPAHPDVGMVLSNLGETLIEAGRSEEAEPIVRRSLAIRESRLGPDHPRVADGYIGLGRILTRRGRFDEAQACLERALSIQQARLAPDHHFVALTQSALGTLYLEMGKLDLARAAYQRTLEINARRLGPDHPDTAAAGISLAMVDMAAARDAAALEGALLAAGTVRRLVARMSRALSERQALEYGAIQSSGLDVILSVAARSDAAGRPGRAGEAFDALVRSRALVLDEMAARHRAILERGSGALVPLIESLARARDDLGKALSQSPDPADPEAFPARAEKARAEVDDAERALAEKSARFRSERSARDAGLQDIGRSLPAGSALVAYARFHRGGTRVRPGPQTYVAFVLADPRRPPELVLLGAAAEVEPLVAAWRRTVAVAPADAAAAAAYHQAAADLRRRIWDPVATRLGRTKTVFIVPDGDLHLVSFNTLPTTGDRYLVETGPTLHYLSAERDLVANLAPRQNARGVLAVGAPDFDADAAPFAAATVADGTSATEAGLPGAPAVAVYRGDVPSCVRSAGLRFEALPGSKEEAREVASLAGRAGRSGSREPVLVLTGREAGEEAVKRSAPGKRILHFATHSFWIGGPCDPGTTADGVPRGVAPNPLLLSGLALAGVNRRDRPERTSDQDDGLLTAEEISTLDLRGTEWTVLSACQSGVGPVLRGEGVFGLRRAFRVAGARSLVMSLWPIADHDAREWVNELYAARLRGLSTAESMRAASRRIVAARRDAGVSAHPATWGAFVSSGDWR